MKFLFTAFGLHNQFIQSESPDHGIFPLSKETASGLDLDYTALMIGEQYTIDMVALEFVHSQEKDFLGPMSKTLRILESEGLLNVIDYGELVNARSVDIARKTELLLEDPMPWVRIARRQWRQLSGEFIDFQQKFGRKENLFLNTEHFGIVNYLSVIGERPDLAAHKEVREIFYSNRMRVTVRERDLLREVVRPLLHQILVNDYLCSMTGHPFLDWSDAKEFYERLHISNWDDVTEEIQLLAKARTFFDVVVPDLRPDNIEAVLRFIRDDKAVSSLRSAFIERLKNGENLDDRFLTEYANHAIQRELSVKRKMKNSACSVPLLLP